MAGVEAVSQVNGAPESSATGSDDGSAAKIQDAFAKGIVQFMGSMLQSMESDVQQACQDSTSDPDAPS